MKVEFFKGRHNSALPKMEFSPLTDAQTEAIQELKRRTINDCSPRMLEDESLFYRFTKARDFKVQDAEAMLRKHIAWRKEFKVDTILTDFKPTEMMLKYCPYSLLCIDKDGSPVIYIDLGNCDPKGIFNCCKKMDFVKMSIYLLEKDIEIVKQQVKKLGKPLVPVSYVGNFENWSFAKTTNKTVLEITVVVLKMYQDNYPEKLKTGYVIGASAYFSLFFTLMKSVLASSIISKITVFGTAGYEESLLQRIDPDQLPAFLGGKRTDPDGNPLCRTFVLHGEPVPERYYLPKSKRTLSLVAGVKKLSISPFAKTDVEFLVEEPGSILEWEFETKSNDIGFGVYFRGESQNEGKKVQLVPKQRIDTCYEPEGGKYLCERSGTYTILFDNSYSWIHQKEIFYRARIILPAVDEHEN